MSALEKLLKNSTLKNTSVLTDSKLYESVEQVPTDYPIINIAFSGSVKGGYAGGVTQFAGPSKHFKSVLSLICAKAYLDKYPDAVCMLYDSEGGMPEKYFDNMGIDKNRVIYSFIKNMEEFKFDIVQQLTGLDRGDKVVFVLDSLGNLASLKEVEDAQDGKTVADMSRAKQAKSIFRIITPLLFEKDLPMFVVNHVYSELGLFAKTIVGGGCVVGETLIIKKCGLNRELVKMQDIKVGDLVLTHNDRYQEVTNIWDPETLINGTPECYKVTFEDGSEVICSENHKFLKDGEWVEINQLNVGEKASHLEITKIEKVGKQNVYDITVAHDNSYTLANGVKSHNTGAYYSSSNIFIMGRQQEKTGTELSGYNFVINAEKSRFIREKTKLFLNIDFEEGINKYSGLLQLALDGNFVSKPSNGWYAVVDQETGELGPKKREKETNTEEFWEPILNNPKFDDYIKGKFQL